MRSRFQRVMAVILLGTSPAWFAVKSQASDPDAVRGHAGSTTSNPGSPRDSQNSGGYSSDQYVIGIGQGDMAKGPIVCQRVSELSARTDLAKQIRVLVKEHMVDRLHERSGRDADQDIELTREEIVQEYLQGVKIIDRHVDVEKKICSATAVMPKSQLPPSPLSNVPSQSSPIAR